MRVSQSLLPFLFLLAVVAPTTPDMTAGTGLLICVGVANIFLMISPILLGCTMGLTALPDSWRRRAVDALNRAKEAFGVKAPLTVSGLPRGTVSDWAEDGNEDSDRVDPAPPLSDDATAAGSSSITTGTGANEGTLTLRSSRVDEDDWVMRDILGAEGSQPLAAASAATSAVVHDPSDVEMIDMFAPGVSPARAHAPKTLYAPSVVNDEAQLDVKHDRGTKM